MVSRVAASRTASPHRARRVFLRVLSHLRVLSLNQVRKGSQKVLSRRKMVNGRPGPRASALAPGPAQVNEAQVT